MRETLPLEKIGSGFHREIHRILHSDGYLDQLLERVEKAQEYFLGILSPIAQRIQDQLQAIGKEKKVKAYAKELAELEDSFIKKIRDIERINFLVSTLEGGAPATSFKPAASTKLKQQKAEAQKAAKDKTPTAEITYRLYQKGKSVKEISEERGLVTGTIEGHLAQYVENGTIPIHDLVEEKKTKKILQVLESEAVGLNEIKSQLPKNYTYGDIKLVIAHQKASS